MNRGLILRAVREIRVSTLAFALGLFAFQLILGMVLPVLEKDFSEKMLQLAFMQRILSALLGTDIGATAGPAVLSVIGWVHPFVLALVWAHAIVVCTRFPAGEVDRGTIDVLMSLPSTRTAIYGCEWVVFMLAGLLVVGVGLGGNVVGGWISGIPRAASSMTLALVVVNLYALVLAVGGLASLLSAVCDRRGRAVGLSFAVLLVSFFLSSMSAFDPTIKAFSALSLLNYFRPYATLQMNASPWSDVFVLLGVATTLWTLGWWIVVRRDFRIV